MYKKIPKFLIIFFLAIFILQIIALAFLLFNPTIASAQTEVNFKPQVTISDFQAGEEKEVGPYTIGNYIKAIYNYGIGIVGIISAAVMMFGGILWLTSAGDSGKVSEAKEWIKASLFGLIIALLSYTILLTINPDLINFRPITIKPITGEKKTEVEPYQGYKKYCSEGNVYNSSPTSTGGTSLKSARNSCIADCGSSGIASAFEFLNHEDDKDNYPHLCCVCNEEPPSYDANYAEKYCKDRHGDGLHYAGLRSVASNIDLTVVGQEIYKNIACDSRFPTPGLTSYSPYPAAAMQPGGDGSDNILICLYCL